MNRYTAVLIVHLMSLNIEICIHSVIVKITDYPYSNVIVQCMLTFSIDSIGAKYSLDYHSIISKQKCASNGIYQK